MDESFNFSLSWGGFVYNVDKFYVPADLERFFIYVIKWLSDRVGIL